MLLNFWLVEICSANLNCQKNDVSFGLFDSYSQKLHQHTNSDDNNGTKKILNLYETETAIYTTSNPTESLKTIMYVCYVSGLLFFAFTVFLFIYAIFKCKQHNYQEI